MEEGKAYDDDDNDNSKNIINVTIMVCVCERDTYLRWRIVTTWWWWWVVTYKTDVTINIYTISSTAF